MREAKFRAWDTKRKKMWSAEEMGQDQLTLMPNGQGFVNVHGTSTKLSTFLPFLIPEQFTGLEDESGKDLDWWEGDIIQKGEIIGAIAIDWEHGLRFMLHKHILCKQDGINGKKIGNIHENPELLESNRD